MADIEARAAGPASTLRGRRSATAADTVAEPLGMLLCLSRGCVEVFEDSVEAAGDVAFEASAG
ncbi:MAG: hypothetical protein ACE367_03450, partial [Acidimicrobiales bacterium]